MAYEPPEKEIPGWMNSDSLEWLYERAGEMSSVLEVGSWKGRSTHALLTGCKGPVFAVDHFKGSPDERQGSHKEALDHDIFVDFWQNVGHLPNLVVMRMDSVRAWRFFAPRSIDMIFIDGCHSREAVLLDLICWHPKCGKLMCGHDVSYDTVRRALDDFGQPWREERDMWRIDVKT